jgi:vancomycin resistance protein YoaR
MKKKGYRITITVKVLILQFLLSSIGIFLGLTLKAHNEIKKWDNLIYPGVRISNLDLSGTTKEEAKSLIKSKYIDLLVKDKINIDGNNKGYVIECSKLIEKYDVDSVVNKAFDFGKNLSFYEKLNFIRQGEIKEYMISFTYNQAYIKEFIKYVEKDINREPINASIQKTSNGKIKVNGDIKGLKLQGEKLEKQIKDRITDGSYKSANINIPVDETVASITVDKISSIDTNISTFKTSFVSSSSERSQNIKLAVQAINGKVLMPGETFSFNKSVGERTKKRGFMEAPVISGGKIEPGLGGGICQVSSTLYNAVLRTGIKPLERVNHTLPSSYVDLGMDATVAWDSIDFKFENTLDYPMFIEGYTQNKNVYINIYSNSSLGKRKYTIANEVYEKIQAKTKTVTDPELPKGKVTTIQKGYDGYRVKVIRNTYENGVLINSEVISNDFYAPVASIIKKGIRSEY